MKRPKPRPWFRATALATLSCFIYTNIVYGAVEPAVRFWSERKANAQKLRGNSDSDPARVPPPGQGNTLLAQLPSVNPNILSSSLPKEGVNVQPSALSDLDARSERIIRRYGMADAATPAALSASGRLPRWFQAIPFSYVSLKDLYLPAGWKPGDLMVLHIQDAHQNYEAQKNIAQAIQALDQAVLPQAPKTSGLSQTDDPALLVGLEGARGAFNFAPYRTFPDPEVNRQVANYLMQQGLITGAEFAGMTGERLPLYWGVENEPLYRAHVQSYLDSSRSENEAQAAGKSLTEALESLKGRIFNPGLKELDAKIGQYHQGTLALGDYLSYISGKSAPAQSPNIRAFLDALALEKSLDFNAVEKERRGLTETLVARLPKVELQNLMSASLAYRVGNLTHGTFYRYLQDLCRGYGVNLARFPQMERYVRYILASERIRSEGLFAEISALEQSRTALLAQSEPEKRLVRLSQDALLIGKLFGYGLSSAEWATYLGRREDIHQIWNRIAQLPSGDASLRRGGADWGRLLGAYEKFSELALSRNRVLVDNLLAKTAQSRQTRLAVLVAGGFHTPGMMEILKQRKIAYAVLTPRLGKVEGDGSAYLQIFRRDKTPLEKLFTGDRITVSPALLTAAGLVGLDRDALRQAGEERAYAAIAAALMVLRAAGRNVPWRHYQFSKVFRTIRQFEYQDVEWHGRPAGASCAISGRVGGKDLSARVRVMLPEPGEQGIRIRVERAGQEPLELVMSEGKSDLMASFSLDRLIAFLTPAAPQVRQAARSVQGTAADLLRDVEGLIKPKREARAQIALSPSVKSLVLQGVVFIAFAALGGLVLNHFFPGTLLDYTTVYFLEQSLSVDNLFVILQIMGMLAITPKHQRKVLLWGLLGAAVFRFGALWVGGAVLASFEWVLYILGGLLIVFGVKTFFEKEDANKDYFENPLIRFVRKFFDLAPRESMKEGRFFIWKEKGNAGLAPILVLAMTPMFLGLLANEWADVVFAVDSVPAALGVTHLLPVVFLSMFTALMMLRTEYFALQRAATEFKYLKYGVGIILVFIGIKTLLPMIPMLGFAISNVASLIFILSVVGISIGASIIHSNRQLAGATRKAVAFLNNGDESDDAEALQALELLAPEVKRRTRRMAADAALRHLDVLMAGNYAGPNKNGQIRGALAILTAVREDEALQRIGNAIDYASGLLSDGTADNDQEAVDILQAAADYAAVLLALKKSASDRAAAFALLDGIRIKVRDWATAQPAEASEAPARDAAFYAKIGGLGAHLAALGGGILMEARWYNRYRNAGYARRWMDDLVRDADGVLKDDTSDNDVVAELVLARIAESGLGLLQARRHDAGYAANLAKQAVLDRTIAMLSNDTQDDDAVAQRLSGRLIASAAAHLDGRASRRFAQEILDQLTGLAKQELLNGTPDDDANALAVFEQAAQAAAAMLQDDTDKNDAAAHKLFRDIIAFAQSLIENKAAGDPNAENGFKILGYVQRQVVVLLSDATNENDLDAVRVAEALTRAYAAILNDQTDGNDATAQALLWDLLAFLAPRKEILKDNGAWNKFLRRPPAPVRAGVAALAAAQAADPKGAVLDYLIRHSLAVLANPAAPEGPQAADILKEVARYALSLYQDKDPDNDPQAQARLDSIRQGVKNLILQGSPEWPETHYALLGGILADLLHSTAALLQDDTDKNDEIAQRIIQSLLDDGIAILGDDRPGNDAAGVAILKQAVVSASGLLPDNHGENDAFARVMITRVRDQVRTMFTDQDSDNDLAAAEILQQFIASALDLTRERKAVYQEDGRRYLRWALEVQAGASIIPAASERLRSPNRDARMGLEPRAALHPIFIGAAWPAFLFTAAAVVLLLIPVLTVPGAQSFLWGLALGQPLVAFMELAALYAGIYTLVDRVMLGKRQNALAAGTGRILQVRATLLVFAVTVAYAIFFLLIFTGVVHALLGAYAFGQALAPALSAGLLASILGYRLIGYRLFSKSGFEFTSHGTWLRWQGPRASGATREQIAAAIRGKFVLIGMDTEALGIGDAAELAGIAAAVQRQGNLAELKYSGVSIAAVRKLRRAGSRELIAVGEIKTQRQAAEAAAAGADILVASALLPPELIQMIRLAYPNVFIISGAAGEHEADLAVAWGADGVKFKSKAEPFGENARDYLAAIRGLRQDHQGVLFGGAGGVTPGSLAVFKQGMLIGEEQVAADFVGRGLDNVDLLKMLIVDAITQGDWNLIQSALSMLKRIEAEADDADFLALIWAYAKRSGRNGLAAQAIELLRGLGERGELPPVWAAWLTNNTAGLSDAARAIRNLPYAELHGKILRGEFNRALQEVVLPERNELLKYLIERLWTIQPAHYQEDIAALLRLLRDGGIEEQDGDFLALGDVLFPAQAESAAPLIASYLSGVQDQLAGYLRALAAGEDVEIVVVSAHRSPDADAILSTLVYAYLMQQRTHGRRVLYVPVMIGEPTAEAAHVLNVLGIDPAALPTHKALEATAAALELNLGDLMQRFGQRAEHPRFWLDLLDVSEIEEPGFAGTDELPGLARRYLLDHHSPSKHFEQFQEVRRVHSLVASTSLLVLVNLIWEKDGLLVESRLRGDGIPITTGATVEYIREHVAEYLARVNLPQQVAQAMLQAFFSDTLFGFSETYDVARDGALVRALIKKAGYGDFEGDAWRNDPALQALWADQVRGGFHSADRSARDLVREDNKTSYKVSGQADISFGQILTDDIRDARRRKAEILREMEAFRIEKGVKAAYMIVTDALTYESEVWAVGAEASEIAEVLARLKDSPQAQAALQQFSALPARAGQQARIGDVEGPRRRGAFYTASVVLPGYVSRKSMWKDVVEHAVGDQYSKSARISRAMAAIAEWERLNNRLMWPAIGLFAVSAAVLIGAAFLQAPAIVLVALLGVAVFFAFGYIGPVQWIVSYHIGVHEKTVRDLAKALQSEWAGSEWQQAYDQAEAEQRQAAGDLTHLRQESVLVTGGAGYIGGAILRLLLDPQNGAKKVVVYDHDAAKVQELRRLYQPFIAEGRLAVVQGELADAARLNAVFMQFKVTSVIHLAADIQVGESVRKPASYYYNNVLMTKVLLDTMVQRGVRKLIFSSSAAVYHEGRLNPQSPYGATKLAMEDLLRDYQARHQIRWVAFRYFNAAGNLPPSERFPWWHGEEHEPESHLIPLIMQALLGVRRFITLFGRDYETRDGTAIRDYVHIADLAWKHIVALDMLSGGRDVTGPYELGRKEGASVQEMIRATEGITKRTVPVVEGPRRAGDTAVLTADNAQEADRVFGVPARHPIEHSLVTAYYAQIAQLSARLAGRSFSEVRGMAENQALRRFVEGIAGDRSLSADLRFELLFRLFLDSLQSRYNLDTQDGRAAAPATILQVHDHGRVILSDREASPARARANGELLSGYLQLQGRDKALDSLVRQLLALQGRTAASPLQAPALPDQSSLEAQLEQMKQTIRSASELLRQHNAAGDAQGAALLNGVLHGTIIPMLEDDTTANDRVALEALVYLLATLRTDYERSQIRFEYQGQERVVAEWGLEYALAHVSREVVQQLHDDLMSAASATNPDIKVLALELQVAHEILARMESAPAFASEPEAGAMIPKAQAWWLQHVFLRGRNAGEVPAEEYQQAVRKYALRIAPWYENIGTALRLLVWASITAAVSGGIATALFVWQGGDLNSLAVMASSLATLANLELGLRMLFLLTWPVFLFRHPSKLRGRNGWAPSTQELARNRANAFRVSLFNTLLGLALITPYLVPLHLSFMGSDIGLVAALINSAPFALTYGAFWLASVAVHWIVNRVAASKSSRLTAWVAGFWVIAVPLLLSWELFTLWPQGVAFIPVVFWLSRMVMGNIVFGTNPDNANLLRAHKIVSYGPEGFRFLSTAGRVAWLGLVVFVLGVSHAGPTWVIAYLAFNSIAYIIRLNLVKGRAAPAPPAQGPAASPPPDVSQSGAAPQAEESTLMKKLAVGGVMGVLLIVGASLGLIEDVPQVIVDYFIWHHLFPSSRGGQHSGGLRQLPAPAGAGGVVDSTLAQQPQKKTFEDRLFDFFRALLPINREAGKKHERAFDAFIAPFIELPLLPGLAVGLFALSGWLPFLAAAHGFLLLGFYAFVLSVIHAVVNAPGTISGINKRGIKSHARIVVSSFFVRIAAAMLLVGAALVILFPAQMGLGFVSAAVQGWEQSLIAWVVQNWQIIPSGIVPWVLPGVLAAAAVYLLHAPYNGLIPNSHREFRLSLRRGASKPSEAQGLLNELLQSPRRPTEVQLVQARRFLQDNESLFQRKGADVAALAGILTLLHAFDRAEPDDQERMAAALQAQLSPRALRTEYALLPPVDSQALTRVEGGVLRMFNGIRVEEGVRLSDSEGALLQRVREAVVDVLTAVSTRETFGTRNLQPGQILNFPGFGLAAPVILDARNVAKADARKNIEEQIAALIRRGDVRKLLILVNSEDDLALAQGLITEISRSSGLDIKYRVDPKVQLSLLAAQIRTYWESVQDLQGVTLLRDPDLSIEGNWKDFGLTVLLMLPNAMVRPLDTDIRDRINANLTFGQQA